MTTKTPHMRRAWRSSNIKRFGFDAEQQELYVLFRTNRLYVYYKVPPRVYRGMIHAKSRGHFLAVAVKGLYRYKELPPRSSWFQRVWQRLKGS